jgi:chromosome segregation ATPase
MKTVKIVSNIAGSKGYDIYPDDLKDKDQTSRTITINPGDNEVLEDDFELLVASDLGFRAMLESKKFETLSGKEIIADKTVKDQKKQTEDALKKVIDDCNKKLAEAKKEYDGLLDQALKDHEKNVLNLKEDRKSAVDKADGFEKQVSDLKTENRSLKVKISEIESENDSLKKKVGKLEAAAKKA